MERVRQHQIVLVVGKIGIIQLSVLDQSPISEGSTGADALRNTLDLARSATGSATRAIGWRSITARRCSPAPARK